MALNSFYNVFNIKYQEKGPRTNDAFGTKFDWIDKFTIDGGILSFEGLNDNPGSGGMIVPDATHLLQVLPNNLKERNRIVINNNNYKILLVDDTILPISFDKHIDVYLRKEGIENYEN